MMYQIARRVVQRTQELKFSDYNNANNISYNGNMIALSTAIAQGDTQNTRDGTIIQNRGVSIHYTVAGNVSAPYPTQTIRVMIVRSFVENNNLLTPGELLQNIGTVTSALSHKNFNLRSKYKVYYDKTHIVASGGNVYPVATPSMPGYPTEITRHAFVKLKFKTTYDGTGIQIKNGCLYLFAISNDAPSGAAAVLAYNTRLYFTDS